MAHVQLRSEGGAFTLLVDGHDLSKAVLREGFHIEAGEEPEVAKVHVVLGADTLDADLPEAVLSALRADGETPEESVEVLLQAREDAVAGVTRAAEATGAGSSGPHLHFEAQKRDITDALAQIQRQLKDQSRQIEDSARRVSAACSGKGRA